MEGYKKKTAFQSAKIKRAKEELAAWQNKQKEDQKITTKKKTTTTNKTIQDNKDDNKGSWGGHGSVKAYDKSQQDTYKRAIDRHRGATGGRIRSYFDGGLVTLRRR